MSGRFFIFQSPLNMIARLNPTRMYEILITIKKKMFMFRQNPGFYGLVMIVAFVSMIGPFSIDTYLPSFVSLEAQFNTGRALSNQTIAFYMYATAISTLFWGPLSDRIGRKLVITGSLFLYTIATVFCAMAESYSDFLLSRVFQGFAASGGMVAGRAMIRDTYDSRLAQKAMSYVLMLFALAPAIAPILGGWLHSYFGWRSIFYFLCLYSVVMLVLSMGSIKESLDVTHRKSFHPLSVLKVYIRTACNIRFISIVMALATTFAGLFIYIAGAPTIIFDIFKLQSTDFWLLFLPATSGIVIGSFLSGKLSRRLPAEKIVYLSLFVLSVGVVINLLQAYFLSPGLHLVVVSMSIYAFGVALSMPAFAILAIDCFPYNKGSASAVQSFIQIIMSGFVAGLLLPFISQDVISFSKLQLILFLTGLGFWFVSARVRQ